MYVLLGVSDSLFDNTIFTLIFIYYLPITQTHYCLFRITSLPTPLSHHPLGKGWRKGYKGSFHTGLGVAALMKEGKGVDLQRRSELRSKYRDFEKSIRTVR